MMQYEQVIQLWGRKLLRDAGLRVGDTEQVVVDLQVEQGGYCETCSYEYAVVGVSCRSGSRTYEDYRFQDILRELVEVSTAAAQLGQM